MPGMEWIPEMLVVLAGGLLCGAIALILRVFGSSPGAGRRWGKAAVWIGVVAVVVMIPLERTNLELVGYLLLAAPILPGALALMIPPKQSVKRVLRVAIILSIVGAVVWFAWYWRDTSPPAGVTVEQPTALPFGPPVAVDAEGDLLVQSSSAPPAPSANVDVDLPVLNAFSGPDRQLLLRHLATSAKWFVGRTLANVQEKMFAQRRYVVGGIWLNEQNGWSPYNGGQFSIVLGLEGPTYNETDEWLKYATFARPDQGKVILSVSMMEPDQPNWDSYLIIKSPGTTLEISETSQRKDRPVTPVVLSQLKQEFQAVLNSPVARRRGFDPALMPPDSIHHGAPEMHLITNDPDDGLYQVQAYVNPGESGYVYSKAFYGRGNSRVLDDVYDYYKRQSIEYTGWSSDPHEQFFYNAECDFWVATFSNDYSARVELWFVPASGAPERKLLEKYFEVR
jgi:hypothetical protein